MTTSHDFRGAINKGNDEGAFQALDTLIQDQPVAMVDLQANPSLIARKEAAKEALRAAAAAVVQMYAAYENAVRLVDEAEEAARLAAIDC